MSAPEPRARPQPEAGAPRAAADGAAPAPLPASLYAKREKIYPREVHGWFATLRVAAVAALLGLFYGVCWLGWDGRQAVLFDLPGRKFHVFGWTFFPQDLVLLALLLIIAALTLFLFTAVAGRLWCGYACPQTVYTELFLWIERQIEGDRPQQLKLDRAPWSPRKVLRKGAKHAAWLAIAAWTGFTFVGYFTPIVDLGQRLAGLALGPWETFWIVFYGFATYGNAGWMREQVCLYMCPYARFQSAMFDRDTLVISYDRERGEPRGSRRRGLDPGGLGLGDCIACTLCVQACPTGIDIREGLQYECIACAACVDACNEVMDRMGYRPGLIRYTTENALAGRPLRVVRPRVLVYAGVLAALVAGLAWSIAARVPLELDVLRDRNALYRERASGEVENVFTLKIVNMDDTPHRFAVSVSGVEGLVLETDAPAVAVEGGRVASVPVRLRVDPARLEQVSTPVVFTIEAVDAPGLRASEETRFLGWLAR